MTAGAGKRRASAAVRAGGGEGEGMARIRRYNLYEGDGEVIGREDWSSSGREEHAPLPGRQPLGRETPAPEEEIPVLPTEKRYFAENERGNAEEVSPLFDDFDRYGDAPRFRQRPRKKQLRHRGAWIAVIVCCLMILLGTGLLLLPQVTGMRYRFLPNIAFANGSVLVLDENVRSVFEDNSRTLYTEEIYPGIHIDGVHVGGMTREEAARVLAEQEESAGLDFDITVSVGNQSWHVNSERVPVRRNLEEIINRAWALGRCNTAATRSGGITPFQERVNRASELRSFPVEYKTETTYDHDALRTLAEGIANYVNREPVNSTVATFDFGTKTFTFTEDVPGAFLDGEGLYTQLCTLLDDGNRFTAIRVTPEKVLAEVTKTELMNSFGLISTYTTKTTSNKNRNTNIDLSARAINGTTVLPGEIFSFNGATGERTAEKGYREAAAISGGSSRDEVGGGVCQTSSTLFNAVARANLEIVERSPHAWPSSYVEKGFDATVNWPGLDFRFKNNTEWPIFIIAGYADRKVTVSVYGMSLGADLTIDLESDTVKVLPQPEGTNYVINTSLSPGETKRTVTGRKGYVVDTWKVFFQNGKEVKREKLFTSTYKAYQETIEYNPR